MLLPYPRKHLRMRRTPLIRRLQAPNHHQLGMANPVAGKQYGRDREEEEEEELEDDEDMDDCSVSPGTIGVGRRMLV